MKNFLVIVGLAALAVWFYMQRPKPAAPEPATPAPVVKTTELPPAVLDAAVTLNGPGGAASGYVGLYKGRPFVVTSQTALALGYPLRLRTRGGVDLVPQKFAAAATADVALVMCANIPADLKPLETVNFAELKVQPNLTDFGVAGNGNRDGTVTTRHGYIRGSTPDQLEIEQVVLPGHLGAGAVYPAQGRVLGVVSEIEERDTSFSSMPTMDVTAAVSGTGKRYVLYRVDTVQQWEALDWRYFLETEAALRQARQELEEMYAYVITGDDRYKQNRDILRARDAIKQVWKTPGRSEADQIASAQRLMRELAGLCTRARRRMDGRTLCYSQRRAAVTVNGLADALTRVLTLMEQSPKSEGVGILVMRE